MRIRIFRRCIVGLLACASSALAQSATKKKQATTAAAQLEGDVYFVTGHGDIKPAPGISVVLVRRSPNLLLDLITTCEEHGLRVDPIRAYRRALVDSLLQAESARSFTDQAVIRRRMLNADTTIMLADLRVVYATESAILGGAIDTTSTGMAAHYKFVGLPPGDYGLFAKWKVADGTHFWWKPLTLDSGQSLRRDLDNSAATTDHIVCGSITPPS